MKFITLTQDDLTKIVNVDQINSVELSQGNDNKTWWLIVGLKSNEYFAHTASLEDLEEQFEMISKYLKSYDYEDVHYEMKRIREYSKKQE